MSAGRYRVLLVEDSVTQALSIQQGIRDAGFEVQVAGNGREALERLKQWSPQIVVTDIVMPEVDGYELCRSVREEYPGIAVVFLTSRTGLVGLIEAISAGGDGYVTKPVNMPFLIQKIREVIAGGSVRERNDSLLVRVGSEDMVLAADARTIVSMMLCTYEDAVLQNQQLREAETGLNHANRRLEHTISELESTKENLRSLVMTVPDIVYRIDVDGRFTFLNDAVRRLGYAPSEMIGRHFGDLILEADVKSVSREYVLPEYMGIATGDADAPKLFDERRSGSRRTSGLETRLVVKPGVAGDGSEWDPEDGLVRVEINSSGIYETAGEGHRVFIGTVGVIRDITDRKRLEGELMAAHNSLEKQVFDRTRQLLEMNTDLEAQIRHRQRAEEELKELLQASKDSQARLVQAEKMSALGTVVSGVAHELNNPMMSILNYVQHSIKHAGDPERLVSLLSNAEKEIQRCVRIVSDLDAISEQDYLDDEALVEVHCTDVFDRLLSLLSFRIERDGVEVLRTCNDGVVPIPVQLHKLHQLFLNLLTNALDSMEGCERKQIEIDSRLVDTSVVIRVADTGTGIAKDDLPKIFDPFFTTKPIGSSVGLGLSVGRSIAEAHGGRIEIQSEKGAGTVVTVSLPVKSNSQKGDTA